MTVDQLDRSANNVVDFWYAVPMLSELLCIFLEQVVSTDETGYRAP